MQTQSGMLNRNTVIDNVQQQTCIPQVHNWQKAMGNWDKLQPEQNYVQYLKQHTGYLSVTYLLFRFFWLHFFTTVISFTMDWKTTFCNYWHLLFLIYFSLLVCVELHYYYLFLSPFCGTYWWLLKWWGRRPEFWGWSLSQMRQKSVSHIPDIPWETDMPPCGIPNCEYDVSSILIPLQGVHFYTANKHV